MFNDDQLNLNPGQRLQNLLKELYSFDPPQRTSFIAKIDDALIADGDFAQLVYNSSINYLLRRMVTTAEYLKRKFAPPDYPPERYLVEIRRFIRNYTHIPFTQVERVTNILIDCLDERRRMPTQTTKNRIRRIAQERGLKCYICGRELNFERDGEYDSAEVEHLWPRTMGGYNNDANLYVSCHQCNQSKKDYIDSTDFHYEEISLVSDRANEDFSTEMKWDYRVALWAKNNFRCIVCGKPASFVGSLQLARRDPNDSWHFLNIDAYCDQHAQK
jgi:hypothetical protein